MCVVLPFADPLHFALLYLRDTLSIKYYTSMSIMVQYIQIQ